MISGHTRSAWPPMEWAWYVTSLTQAWPQILSSAPVRSAFGTSKKFNALVSLQCGLCHQSVCLLRLPPRTTTTPHEKKDWVPEDGLVWVSASCLTGEKVIARETQARFSQVLGVVLPVGEDEDPLDISMSVPLPAAPEAGSLLPSVPMALLRGIRAPSLSGDAQESIYKTLEETLTNKRDSIAQEITAYIQQKQKELLSTYEVTSHQTKLMLDSVNMKPAPVVAQLNDASPHKAAQQDGMFMKRNLPADTSDMSRSYSALSVSFARHQSSAPPVSSAVSAQPFQSPLQRDTDLDLDETLEEGEAPFMGGVAKRNKSFTYDDMDELELDALDEPDGTDHVFAPDEELEGNAPEPNAQAPPAGVSDLVEDERIPKDELATSLLHRGMATSFSAIPALTERLRKCSSQDHSERSESADRNKPFSSVNRSEPLPPTLESVEDEYDEDLVLADAVNAHAPSHRLLRRTGPAPAVSGLHGGHLVAWRQRALSTDTHSLVRSVPSSDGLPMKMATRRDVSYGIDREPKTSLPNHEKRLVPSLLKAVRRTSTAATQGVEWTSSKPAARTTGFQVASSTEPQPITSPKPAHQLPPVPYVPSASVRLEPSSTLAPRALSMPNDLPESDEHDVAQVLYFMHHLQNLKLSKRTGWYHHNVPSPESIADHMYRMALLAMLLDVDGIDVQKCAMMALVHDLAEALVGDLTPLCKVSKNEKQQREQAAMRELTELLGNSVSRKRIIDLWHEYEERESEESKLVKDLDLFELCLQAYEYEAALGIKDLQPFWQGAALKVSHPQVQRWVKGLLKKRQALWHARGVEYDTPAPSSLS